MADVAVAKAEDTALGGTRPGPNDPIAACAGGKDPAAPTDLPQDYSPFSPGSPASPSRVRGGGVCPTADAHTWISPNKSDEVPASKEGSPATEATEAAPAIESKTSSERLDTSASSTKTNFGSVDFEPAATDAKPDLDLSIVADAKPDLDLSIVGERLEIQNGADPCVATDVVLRAPSDSKDFVKITHGGKEIMLVLPSEANGLGSTLELSETLATSLGITEGIVGLKTTALLLDEEVRHRGDVVLPFSSLASGQLSALLRRDDREGVPSFELVTSSFESCAETHRAKAAVAGEEGEESLGEESSAVSAKEGVLYTEVFVKLMEQSEDFDPFEKNSLLTFGVDESKQADILYGAAFRVAVYTGDMNYFVQGLKAIAKILPGTKAPSSDDTVMEAGDIDDCSVALTKQASMTIYGLTDFVIVADELFESNELSAQQYVTLLNAFFVEHSSVQALFDLYHNPDFLLACDSDEGLCQSLCMRDLLHLGKKLEPLQPQSKSRAHDEELLKWAIKTGIHNFISNMSTEVPQEFIGIIYHMFSSGDEMVLAACQRFVDMDDSDPVEEMLRREWDIFQRNKAFRDERNQCPAGVSDTALSSSAGSTFPNSNECPANVSSTVSSSSASSTFPDCLLTAVACLVDSRELPEEKGTALLASYARGNQLIHDTYDYFIRFGDIDEFLSMLKAIADTDLEETTEVVTRETTTTASNQSSTWEEEMALVKEDLSSTSQVVATVASDVTKHAEDAFLQTFFEDNPSFGQLEIAALRLASLRKDPQLAEALLEFRDGDMDSASFQKALLNVIKNIVHEIDEADAKSA